VAKIKEFYEVFPNNKVLGHTQEREETMEANGKVTAKKQKTTKKGEPYYVLMVNNDFYYLFQNQSAEQYRHVQEDVAVGDFVDLKAKKSGDFYHVTDIMKIQHDSIPEPPEPETPQQEKPKEHKPIDEFSIRQTSIISQSSLASAIKTVELYDRKGMSAEQIDAEIKRVWRKYFSDNLKAIGRE